MISSLPPADNWRLGSEANSEKNSVKNACVFAVQRMHQDKPGNSTVSTMTPSRSMNLPKLNSAVEQQLAAISLWLK